MRTFLKWVGRIVGGLVILIIIAVGTVYALAERKLNGTTYTTATDSLSIPNDAASIEHGRHLVAAVGKCAACHGQNLGGELALDDPAFARLTAPNITPSKAGVGAKSNADLVRSIRYGVRSDGKSLIFMPSEAFNRFSDRDLAAIIAYLRTVPPVDAAPPPKRSVGPIGRALLAFGVLKLPAEIVRRGSNRLPDVPEGATREYGDYLVTTGGCTGCHGESLSGGREIDGVPAANLTPAALGKWTEADFVKAIRNGVRPDGRILSAVMPWPLMKELSDTELSAMWMYLRSIPARETGK
jgi:mono/diheme cytochrome c family protein